MIRSPRMTTGIGQHHAECRAEHNEIDITVVGRERRCGRLGLVAHFCQAAMLAETSRASIKDFQ